LTKVPLVLIVDDQPDNLYMYTHYLETHGKLRLVTASNGAEALVKAKRFVPDLVVLDVAMAGMDGFEVRAALAADPVTAKIPVILLSAYASAKEALGGRAADIASFVDEVAEGYVSKPCLPNVLLEHVQKALTRAPRVAASA
jgi:CheY-like chemotaxis protein